MGNWTGRHPGLWEFVKFNVLANIATVTNFILMWLGTGFMFSALDDIPFKFFVFDYTAPESLGLCGFLSFLLATTAAQIVNYIVQKNLTFKSDASFSTAAPRYAVMVIVLVVISAALPGHSQVLLSRAGLPESLVPTLANIVNIFVQVIISYPSMKFWVMPTGHKKTIA